MANSLGARRAACVAVCAAFVGAAASAQTISHPVALETTITLPDTGGRIDHLDIDVGRKHLFVAELGNGSVDVIDLASSKVVKRVSGLKEPQGIVFAPKADVLVVACGGDGTVNFYNGEDFTPRGSVKLGDDADDARLDPTNGRVVVGYGSGAIAIIDPANAALVKSIPLEAHPEGFQLADRRAFVNVPDVGKIEVADLDAGRIVATWVPPGLNSNFPMALGEGGDIAISFRSPAMLALFDGANGRIVSRSASCSDADDIYFDARRQRYYISCGAGEIDAFAVTGGALRLAGRTSTSWGARTSLFVPQLDRLFLAVRVGLLFGSNASIQVYRPTP